MNDTTIQAKVDEFVKDTKGFTSVDIGNAIKTDGTWISNREVAAFLRRWTPPANYGITKVSVDLPDGGTAMAGVYLPDTMAVADYTATKQEAMKPEEFEKLHGYNPLAPAAPTPPKDYPVDPAADAAAKNDHTITNTSGKKTAGQKLATMFKWPGTAR